SSALSFPAERWGKPSRKAGKPSWNGVCAFTDRIALPLRELSLTPAGGCHRVSLQLEFDELEARRAGVLDATRFARVLPDEVAVIGGHAAIRISRNDFRQHASMHVDAQARRTLRDLSGRLAGLQDRAPGAHPRVIHDLGEAGNAGAV